jgi:hypothetical protein
MIGKPTGETPRSASALLRASPCGNFSVLVRRSPWISRFYAARGIDRTGSMLLIDRRLLRGPVPLPALFLRRPRARRPWMGVVMSGRYVREAADPAVAGSPGTVDTSASLWDTSALSAVVGSVVGPSRSKFKTASRNLAQVSDFPSRPDARSALSEVRTGSFDLAQDKLRPRSPYPGAGAGPCWRARRDSNPQPSDPKSDALSN